MRIGGRAYRNGVRLVGENYSVKAYYKEDQLNYSIAKKKTSNNNFLKWSKKIPIIRGIVNLFFALFNFFKEATNNPKRYWPIILLIALELLLEFYIIFMPEQSIKVINTLAQFDFYQYFFLLLIIAFILRATLLKEIFKFHGAEHKAVNYYEHNYQNSLIEESRLANRCGTNLIVFYLIIIYFLPLIGINSDGLLINLLAIGIAYEIISSAPASIISIAFLAQKFTTIEPDEKHLRAAKTALTILLAKEEELNSKQIL